MSKPVNGASERSKRREAKRRGASERSERCERTNIASDRVALLVPSLKGIKTRNSAFLGQSVKICIQGQFFMLNKTRWGTCLIF